VGKCDEASIYQWFNLQFAAAHDFFSWLTRVNIMLDHWTKIFWNFPVHYQARVGILEPAC